MSTLRLDEPMSCQEVRDLLPRLKTLDAEKRGRVRGHLKRCKECVSVLVEALKDEDEFVREAAAEALLEEKTLPASLLQNLPERWCLLT